MTKNLSHRIQQFNAEQYKHKVKYAGYYYHLGRSFKHREDVALSFLPGGEKILDVGCGEGKLLIKASSKYKSCIGIDIVPFRIKNAQKETKKRSIKNIKYFVKNIDEEGLSFKDGEFDAIVCLAVMEYLFDPNYVIGEFNRLLKKDGIFVIQVPNVAYILERLKLLLGQLPAKGFTGIGWSSGRLHNFTLSTLEELIKASGFSIVSTTGSGFLPLLRTWWLSLLSADIIIVAKKNKLIKH